MITANFVHNIREQLSNKIAIESSGRQSCMIHMPFIFDDGDPFEFSLAKTGDGKWILSDSGATVRRASYSGADLLAPGHIERFQKIAGFYGVTEDMGVLLLPVVDDDFSSAIYTFTQTCLEIVNLAKLPKERQEPTKTDFAKRVATVVESAVPENRRIARWHHSKFDPERVYMIDYLIKGKLRDWYLFGVNNSMHAARATIACYHYKRARVKFGSIAIYDHEEQLSVRDTVPLNEVVDKKFPRVREKTAIHNFLENEVA